VLEQQLGDSYDPHRFRAANAILRIAGVRKGVEPASRRRASGARVL
jgi:hypothetical protein